MKKSNKILIIILIILFIIILTALSASIIISINNKLNINNKYEVVIYQYEVVDYNINYHVAPKELYREDFTNELSYNEIIYSSDKTYYNEVVIDNGVIYVKDANCLNHICMKNKIKIQNSIFQTTTITCMPSGLVITLEQKEQ